MNYDKLSVTDRVRRTIEATAERDFAEVRKLLVSCPKEKVEVTNLEYLNTTRMLMRVAGLFELEVRGMLLNINAALQAKQHDVMLHQMNEIAAAKAAWHQFCSSYGLEPEVLIGTAGGHHPAVANALQSNLDADPESIQQWTVRFQIAASGEVLGEVKH